MERVRRVNRPDGEAEARAGQARRAADGVLALQRAYGNQAVARALRAQPGSARGRGALVQRDIEVRDIDFDPRPGGGFRHGYIRAAQFFTSLFTALNTEAGLEIKFKNKLRNVIDVVKQNTYIGPDVDQIRTTIVDDMIKTFLAQGLGAANTIKRLLERHVTTQLVANMIPDWTMDMDQEETKGFDQLKNITGEQNMSRSKGRASQIRYAQLPQGLSATVLALVNGITTENQRWTAAALRPEFTLPRALNFDAGGRQRNLNHYQGNHSNAAGWLPAANAPASAVATVHNAVYANASTGLKNRLEDENPGDRLGLTGAHAGRPNRYRTEYLQLLGAAPYGLTDQTLRRSVWAELTAGVSAYIEFNTTSAVSRIVYDCVGDRIYLSVHYKWREGYNPWFEVTQAPAPVF
jgi:hypothetical protein